MKKIMILVVLVLAVSFAGCGREEEKEVFNNGPASSEQENVLTENVKVEEALTENTEVDETEEEKRAKELENELDRILREQVCKEAIEEADKTQQLHTMTKEEVADKFEEHGLTADYIMNIVKK